MKETTPASKPEHLPETSFLPSQGKQKNFWKLFVPQQNACAISKYPNQPQCQQEVGRLRDQSVTKLGYSNTHGILSDMKEMLSGSV